MTMRTPKGSSKRVVGAMKTLRGLARSKARAYRCPHQEEDLFQIACEAVTRAEETFKPDPRGASFATFAWTVGSRAIRKHLNRDRKQSVIETEIGEAVDEEAGKLPTAAPRFDQTDDELRAELDDVRFAFAGAQFVRVARIHPEVALEAAQRVRAVRAALVTVLAEMNPADREILKRHAIDGEPLGKLFQEVPGWSGEGAGDPHYAWRKVLARLAVAMHKRGGVSPDSVRRAIASGALGDSPDSEAQGSSA